MMSIAQVRSAGSAGNYYTDKDNYYVLGSMGERWAGKGAEQLGLQGSVDKDVFTRLLEGRLPDGADLSRMQDGSNKHRPGYDLTFSAPKSVSMMAMLGGDKRLIDAHNQAVDFAVRQVEALASTRVMTDGQSETVLTGNLVMALFNHDTSRDQEPQLHTHAVVANVTQHNGEWKTLSSDKVGKTGFIFKARPCRAGDDFARLCLNIAEANLLVFFIQRQMRMVTAGKLAQGSPGFYSYLTIGFRCQRQDHLCRINCGIEHRLAFCRTFRFGVVELTQEIHQIGRAHV